MRDSKQVVGVLAFLLALPAWASDMCELGLVLLLPPAFLLIMIAIIVGAVVRKPMTALIWGVLLLLLAIPGMGAAFRSLDGAFHGQELKHEGMYNISAATLLAQVAVYAWALGRLFMAFIKGPLAAAEGSRPA